MQAIGKVKPILFNTEMVKAILDGRKTVTRRVVKPHYKDNDCGWQIITNAHTHEFLYAEYYDEWDEGTRLMEPPYQPGDILYVRESVFQGVARCLEISGEMTCYLTNDFEYYADGKHEKGHWKDKDELVWMNRRPSIHMPKEAARIWLKVTDVNVERLQDITEEQARMEGISLWDDACYASNGWFPPLYDTDSVGEPNFVGGFHSLWDSTIKKSDLGRYGWDANPYVWVIAFERCEKPEPCILKGIDPAESKRPCIGYAVSDINDEPCEMCKGCKQCSGNDVCEMAESEVCDAKN